VEYKSTLFDHDEGGVSMAYVITEECLACGACLSECPSGAIEEGDIYVINDDCVECGACVDACPSGAIQEK